MERLGPLFCALAVVLFSVPLFAGELPPVPLTILPVNDFHGRFLPDLRPGAVPGAPAGGAAHLAGAIRAARAKNPDGTLLPAAGDMYQGTPASNLFQGKPALDVMNVLGSNALEPGNHEFDWWMDAFRRLAGAASFPILSATVTNREGRPLEGLRPFLVPERRDVKIGVIGVSTQDTPYTTKPETVKELVFLDPAKALPEAIRDVRAAGAAVVIVLSHLGFDEDKKNWRKRCPASM